MSSMRETAEQFFVACETGKGWDGCQSYCHEGATFSAQAGRLEDVDTVEGYTEWSKELLTLLPDGNAEIRSLAVDDDPVPALPHPRGSASPSGGSSKNASTAVRSALVSPTAYRSRSTPFVICRRRSAHPVFLRPAG